MWWREIREAAGSRVREKVKIHRKSIGEVLLERHWGAPKRVFLSLPGEAALETESKSCQRNRTAADQTQSRKLGEESGLLEPSRAGKGPKQGERSGPRELDPRPRRDLLSGHPEPTLSFGSRTATSELLPTYPPGGRCCAPPTLDTSSPPGRPLPAVPLLRCIYPGLPQFRGWGTKSP